MVAAARMVVAARDASLEAGDFTTTVGTMTVEPGANNVIPHGDTIAGLKYVGRRFVADCARAERVRERTFFGRLGMQLSLAGRSAGAIRRVRMTEQLA